MLVIAGCAYIISPAVTMLTHNTTLSRTAQLKRIYFSSLVVLVGVPAT